MSERYSHRTHDGESLKGDEWVKGPQTFWGFKMGMKWLRNNFLKMQNIPRKRHKGTSDCTKHCKICHPKQTKSKEVKNV